MDKFFISKIKEKLIKERKILIEKSIKDQDIEIDVDGDEFDEIQGNLLIELNNQLNTRNALKIIKINEALKKIDDNTYGQCQDCGEDIPEKRLEYNPHVLTCVLCAEDREIQEKQKKRD